VSKLPRGLIFILALTAAGSFALSMYLENYHLAFLQNHPISVNLISGVVGFSTAALVVSIGFKWWARLEEQTRIQRALMPLFDARMMLGDICYDFRDSGIVHADYPRGRRSLRALAARRKVFETVRRVKQRGLIIPAEAESVLAELDEMALTEHLSSGADTEQMFREQMKAAYAAVLKLDDILSRLFTLTYGKGPWTSEEPSHAWLPESSNFHA
jgi:hypothetical protein